MEKRTLERIPVNVDVEFYCNDRVYHGTVKNLSEKGMFISTKRIYFPFDMKFEMYIPRKEKSFRLPVNLARMTTSPDSSDALGVEVQGTSQEYLEFVNSLRYVYEP